MFAVRLLPAADSFNRLAHSPSAVGSNTVSDCGGQLRKFLTLQSLSDAFRSVVSLPLKIRVIQDSHCKTQR